MVKVFSDNTKIRCSKFVGFISLILFLGGGALLGFSIYKFTCPDVTFPASATNYTDFSPESLIPTLALLAGSLMLITSMFGCCTSKFKKICFTFPFIILALVICILMFILATVTSGQGVVIEQMQDNACLTDLGGMTTGEKIDKEYTKMVDRMMCSA
jgi:hypothetical protein